MPVAAALGRDAMPYEVARAITRDLSANGPVVFVLEDGHWSSAARDR
jgi:hypothetical protein